MYIIVLHEKFGERYINAGYTDASIATTAAAIVRERIGDRFYSTEEIKSANYYLERNKAVSWLRTRSTRQYEGVSIQTLETLE
jgi:hypothetical protein